MRHLLSIAIAALLATSITACKQDPTCESVADHVLGIAKAEMSKMLEQVPEEQRKQMEERMKADFTKEKMIEECNKQSPTTEALQCALDAKTMADMAKCDMSKGKAAPEGEGGAEAPAAEGDEDPAAEGDEAAADEGEVDSD